MTRWPPLPADVAPVPGQMKGKTMTDKAEIEVLVKRAAGMTRHPAMGGRMAEAQDMIDDMSTALTALQAQLAAAEALLGAAYRAALEDAANRCDTFRGIDHIAQDMDLGIFPQQSERQEAISRAILSIPTPADLAARLAKEAGE